MSAGLPTGFVVRLRDDVSVLDEGRLLVGGSPLTSMRLTPRARELITGGSVRVSSRDAQWLADRLLEANIADPVLRTEHRASPADLTVVIPVRDRADELERAVRALRPTLACLVVDDASLDPGAVSRVADRLDAQLIRLPENVGPAGARNAGLARVRTPYVAFVDCDVVVDAATLLTLTEHFVDPAVAMVAPRIVDRARSERPRWFERFEEVAGSLGLGLRGCTVAPGAAVAWVPSACLVARVDMLASGFDSTMRVGEDVDLVWRLVAQGRRVRYDPAQVAAHDVRPTLRAWLGRKFVYGTGGAPLAARHGSHVAVAVFSPAYAVAAAAVLLRRRWAIPLAVAVVVRGAQRLRRRLGGPWWSVRVPTRLALQGLGWAVRQESALLLRHWWPPVAVGCLLSPHLRRAVATALLVDTVVARAERLDVPLVISFAGRRLDDLAYGSGLWWGALRARSLAAVQVRVVTGSRRGGQRYGRPQRPPRTLRARIPQTGPGRSPQPGPA